MTDYRAGVTWLRRNILRQNIEKSPPYGSAQALPTHRPRIANTHNVDIMLPTSVGDGSECDAKAWDELSLKMPELAERDSWPSSTGTNLPTTVERQCSTPLDTSKSSPFPAMESCTPTPSSQPHSIYPPRVPVLTFTRPSETSTAQTDVVSPPAIQVPPFAHQRVPSPTVSRPTSIRRSTSTDLGITVSQAYLPDADTTSRYHEEGFLSRDTSSGPLPTHPEPWYSHGGIRMTVEQTVV